MDTRARSAAETGERILDAMAELFWEKPLEQISLEDVASRAGVTVQTVLRRFGNKQQLFAAVSDRERQRVVDHRSTAPVGDVEGAIVVLVDHYEQLGDRVMKLLGDEDRSPVLAEMLESGRKLHRDWCSRVFAPSLERLTGSERKRRLAQFVAICDVYTWKLLRRDSALSRPQTERALVEMLVPLAQVS